MVVGIRVGPEFGLIIGVGLAEVGIEIFGLVRFGSKELNRKGGIDSWSI